MLMVVMYHHINSDDLGLSNEMNLFREHMAYIRDHFNCVLPGDKLSDSTTNICLTFDDAYFDFYHYVFPVLKQFKLRAMLGVPVRFIGEATDLPAEKRLSLKHDDIYRGDNYKTHASFCTYAELQEMIDSGLVCIASHSYTHSNLVEDDVDMDYELGESKRVLEERLNIKVDTFIIPFGRYDTKVLQAAKKYYQYIMRIGNGINRDFGGVKGLIYRVKGDRLTSPSSIFSFGKLLKYRYKTFIKSVA
jgi:peptidoglycan/xylan/chitin deacetylase (PgdA/CDA1 family)